MPQTGAKTTAARLAWQSAAHEAAQEFAKPVDQSCSARDKTRATCAGVSSPFLFHFRSFPHVCHLLKCKSSLFPPPLLPSFLPPPGRSEALHVSVLALRKAEQPLTNIQLSETAGALWELQSLVCFVLFFRLTL